MNGRPLVNPFPAAKGGGEEWLNAHHNPMQPFRTPSRRAAYQPKEPKPAPRSIPDQAFNDLFAALDCNRDRALIAFYISTGARASELLGTCQGLVAPEDQVIGVIRKGSRALQRLPASTDAFVWLRLYQQELRDMVPQGPEEALWWTLRRPFRPLTYDATRMVFNKANAALGANWTLHDLRHSAAKRMVRDPDLTLADVQWVLGHAHITTTEIYTAPTPDEVIAHVLAHHERQRTQRIKPPAPPAPGYRPEVLATLFGAAATDGRDGDRHRVRPRSRPGQCHRGGAAHRIRAEASRARLVADSPKSGGIGRAAARPVHRAGCEAHPRQDPRRGLTKLLDWLQQQPGGYLAGPVAGQRRGHRRVRLG